MVSVLIFGFVLLNCLVEFGLDAQLLPEAEVQQGHFGMGMIARDSSGEVAAAMACKGQGSMAPEVAEACAMLRGLQWARNLSLNKIIVESDCASVVTAVNTDLPTMNSNLGSVLSDCRMLMISFQTCRFQHTRRESNSVAHELAEKSALQAEADERKDST